MTGAEGVEGEDGWLTGPEEPPVALDDEPDDEDPEDDADEPELDEPPDDAVVVVVEVV